jgi:glutamine synthetase
MLFFQIIVLKIISLVSPRCTFVPLRVQGETVSSMSFHYSLNENILQKFENNIIESLYCNLDKIKKYPEGT